MKLDELARAVEVKEYANIAMAVKRSEARQRRDPQVRQALQHVLKLLNVKM